VPYFQLLWPIERELPAIGSAERQALQDAAQKSNATLKELGPEIQWVESYRPDDRDRVMNARENGGAAAPPLAF
jgi:hypothetical protein